MTQSCGNCLWWQQKLGQLGVCMIDVPQDVAKQLPASMSVDVSDLEMNDFWGKACPTWEKKDGTNP